MIGNGNNELGIQNSSGNGQNVPTGQQEQNMIPTIPQSAVQSVTDNDDLASLKNKFKVLRRENIQLRNLLKQSEIIV